MTDFWLITFGPVIVTLTAFRRVANGSKPVLNQAGPQDGNSGDTTRVF